MGKEQTKIGWGTPAFIPSWFIPQKRIREYDTKFFQELKTKNY